MKYLQKFSTIKKYPKLILSICFVLLVVVVLLSLCIGAVNVPMKDLIQVLRGQGSSQSNSIFYHVRLPRTIATLFAGAALSTAGLIIQGVLDNPLAGPSIIGVNSGAGFVVVLCSAVLPTFTSLLPIASFIGALCAMLLVYNIGRIAKASRSSIILAGVAINGILNAGIDVVVTFFPDALIGSNAFKIGGVSGITMQKLFPQIWLILLAIILSLLISGDMDILVLGEETAKSLGMNVSRYRFILLLLAALLSGLAVSFCGLIGFIGLLVPHISRRIMGDKTIHQMLFCIISGGIFLTGCDLIARTLFSPFELPVGLILAILGGPFFLWILLNKKRGAKHD